MVTLRSRWYLSAAAIRQYLEVMRRADDDGGPEWGRAEQELAALADSAHQVLQPDGTPALTRGGHQRWRTGRPLRLQMIVSTSERVEGDLPQLVSVVGR